VRGVSRIIDWREGKGELWGGEGMGVEGILDWVGRKRGLGVKDYCGVLVL
jgi:hypothetical protein